MPRPGYSSQDLLGPLRRLAGKTPAAARPVFRLYFSSNLTVTVNSAFTAFPSRTSGS